MTGITFNPTANNWNVLIDRPTGEVLHGTAATPDVAMQILEQAMRRSTAPANQSHLCVRVRAMRRFFGIATEVGLGTSSDDQMRSAIGDFLGRYLSSRRELTAFEWMVCGDAVKSQLLTW